MRPSLFAAVASAHVCLALTGFLIPGASAEALDGAATATNSPIESATGSIANTGDMLQKPPAETVDKPADLTPAASPLEMSPLASKLQELIAARLATYLPRKEDRTGAEAFYRERGYQPIWFAEGAADQRAQAATAFLKNVASQGLSPVDYPTPDFAAAASDYDKAAAELKLTSSVLTYARHASSGRVSFTRVSGAILYPSHAPEPAKVLNQVATSMNVKDTLASFEPQHPEYKALKAELAKVMAGPEASPLEALAEEPKAHKGKSAKASHKVVHHVTRAETVALITANMERWRWLPRDLGATHVTVNIPNYTLAVYNDGKAVWQTKIVAGQPGDKATPLLSETMKFLTVNPTWNVPPSIIRNEYLPALERDPNALERIGLKVGRNHDGSIRVYQPPGARNALGRIRFNFPNPFLVYQHDTPNKNLFAKDERAFSHGCMRVQNPEKYAEVLLSLSQPKDGYTEERIRKMYGDEERAIHLRHPVPVHVTYQTAFFDEAGHFKTRSDVYGLDAAVTKLLRGDERSVADKPIARNYESSSKPVAAHLPKRAVAQRDRSNDRYDHYDRGYVSRRAEFQSPFAGFFDRAVGTW
jgi:murein L,D-transpeptidase YcbB/YkuD